MLSIDRETYDAIVAHAKKRYALTERKIAKAIKEMRQFIRFQHAGVSDHKFDAPAACPCCNGNLAAGRRVAQGIGDEVAEHLRRKRIHHARGRVADHVGDDANVVNRQVAVSADPEDPAHVGRPYTQRQHRISVVR